MTKNKGERSAQNVTPESSIQPGLPGPTNSAAKKLQRQIDKQEADERWEKEQQKRNAAESKKKPKANKADNKKKHVDDRVNSKSNKTSKPEDFPTDAGFKGASEMSGENFKFPASRENSKFLTRTLDLEQQASKSEPQASYPNYAEYRGEHYYFDLEKKDAEYQDFILKKYVPTQKITEKKGDLFLAPKEFALAHCVAEDFHMGAGIALTFRSKYKQVAKLLNQNQRTGGLAFLKHEERFIYYLVTKKQSRGKPTMYTLWLSLLKLRKHCLENEVTKLAIPQMGCGLDRLDWKNVKKMIACIFADTRVEIVVYIWEQPPEDTQLPPKTPKKSSVVHKVQTLVNIDPYTGLLYFAPKDGSETEQLANLSVKYPNLVAAYKREPKCLGGVVRTPHPQNKEEYIYGLIIKESMNSPCDFTIIEKALLTLRNLVTKDKYEYVAFEGFVEDNDYLIVDKILSLMQFILKNLQIWVCWPQHLSHFCPQPNF